jgi:hypothetical protein
MLTLFGGLFKSFVIDLVIFFRRADRSETGRTEIRKKPLYPRDLCDIMDISIKFERKHNDR